MTPTKHPNAFLPLMMIGRATDTLAEDTLNLSEADQDKLDQQIDTALRKLLTMQKIPFAKDAETEELMDLATSRIMAEMETIAEELGNDFSKSINNQSSDTAGESSHDTTSIASHITPHHKQAILDAERDLKQQVLTLPFAQFCDWHTPIGQISNAGALESWMRARFQQKLAPAVDDGYLMFASPGDVAGRPHLTNPVIRFDADGETHNHPDDQNPEIVIGGKQVGFLCSIAPATLGAMHFDENAFTTPHPTPQLDEDPDTLDAKLGMNFGVLQTVLRIEAANEVFLEGLDFLIAHEYAHLALDTPSDLENLPRSDIEFRADMLSAAVVDAAHPASTLQYCRARVQGVNRQTSMSSSIQQGSMVSDSLNHDTPGPQMLMIFLSQVGYEQGKGYPKFDDRYARLDEALYNLDYWGDKK
jgi:hypothetical protein